MSFKKTTKSNLCDSGWRLFIIVALLIIKPGVSNGQKTNANPSTSSYNKFIDIPVSHYTGVSNISIPIYTINEGDISVPVSLNYHSGGFKVYEEASWVGLGWSLKAGGAITRQIRGYDDLKKLSIPSGRYSRGDQYCTNFVDPTNSASDFQKFGCKFYNNYGSPIGITEYLGNNEQHDIFYYNANGISGKFIIHDGKVRLLSKSNIKIDIITEDSNDLETCTGFIITDTKGTKYYFDKEGEQSEVGSSFRESQVTDWYMTKIVSSTNFTIGFEYSSGSVKTSDIPQEIYVENKKEPIESSNLYVNDTHLRKITFSTGYIQFITSSREDLIDGLGKKLSQISIVNGINQTYNLQYNYFKSDNVNTDYTTKRLKLQEIVKQVVGADKSIKWNMKYYGDENDPDLKLRLPQKNSLMQDHWGYYNGKSINDQNSTLIPDIPGIFDDFKGANREADGAYMHACMLKSITFPLGYTTTFEYEPNDYYRENATYIKPIGSTKPVNSFEENTIGGGVRIKRITTSGSGKQITRQYEYKNDKGQSSGIFHGGIVYHNMIYTRKRGRNGNVSEKRLIIRSSNGFKGQSANGVVVGYSKVTEYINGDKNGKKEFYFYNKSNDKYPIWNIPGSVITKYAPWEWNCGDYELMPVINFLSFTQNNQSDEPASSAGLPKKVIDYKKEGNTFKEVKKTEFDYSTQLISEYKNIRVMPVEGLGSTDVTSIKQHVLAGEDGSIAEAPPTHKWGLLYYLFFEYPEFQYWSQLDKTYTTIDGMTTEQSLLYEDSYYKVREKSTRNSLGANMVMRYYYPFDYSTDIISCKELVDRNIIDVPIKVEQYKGSKKTSGSITIYNKYGLPTSKHAYFPSGTTESSSSHNSDILLPDDDSYVEMERFSYEPERLRVNEHWQRGMPLESYFWDKPYLHPMVHVINCSYENLKGVIGEPTSSEFDTNKLNTIGNVASNNSQLVIDEDELRSSLPEAYVTTYKYQPGVGLISSTDANGISVYNTYDEWGRPKCNLNDNKDIITSYEYSFNEQPTEIVPQPISINVTRGADPYPSIVYTYQVDPVPGAENYQWTIPSDGEITDGGSTNYIKVKYNKRLRNSKVYVAARNSNGNSVQISADAQPCEIDHDIENIVFEGSNFRTRVFPFEVYVTPRSVITAKVTVKDETDSTPIMWDVPEGLSISLQEPGYDWQHNYIIPTNLKVEIRIPEDTPWGKYACYAYRGFNTCEGCHPQKFLFWVIVGDGNPIIP